MIRPIQIVEGPVAGPVGLHAFLLRSLREQWREYRKDFRRCRRKFSRKNVHRFRVESRRLLSTISALEAVTPGSALKSARRAVKKRLRIFAPLRDTHVQLLVVEQLVKDHPELSAFRRALARRERRLTKRIARKMKLTGLRKVARPVTAIKMELCSLLTDRKWEGKNLRAVMDELKEAFLMVAARRRAIDPEKPATIHRTRVAFKKFRYMVEALQPILPGVNEAMIDRMQDYQSRMGDIQDASVLRAALKEFLSDPERRMARAAVVLVKLDRRRNALVRSFVKQADELSAFAPAGMRFVSRREGKSL